MKKLVLVLALIVLASISMAQVAKVEVQGVETTKAHTRGISAIVHDGSVGEAMVVIKAVDDAGNPVAGAAVIWTVKNNKANPVYVVASSASKNLMLERVYEGGSVEIDGGVTDENGEAFLIVDAGASADAKIYVTVDGVAGKTYRGKDMRVVWF